MEIKLVVDGKEIQMTEKQLIDSGVYYRPYYDKFEATDGRYYYITDIGTVASSVNAGLIDWTRISCGNYCTDMKLMKNRALYEELNRRLWRFAKQSESVCGKKEWYIAYDQESKEYRAVLFSSVLATEIAFQSKKVAEMAINEVIVPFLRRNNIQSIEDIL